MPREQVLIFAATQNLADLYMTEADSVIQAKPELLPLLLQLLCTSTGLDFAGIARGNSQKWWYSFSMDINFPDPEFYDTFKGTASVPNENFAFFPIILDNGEIFGSLRLYDGQSLLSRKREQVQPFVELITLQVQKEHELKTSLEKLRVKDLELNYLEKEIRQYQHISSHTLKEPLRKLQFYTDLIESEIKAGNTNKLSQLTKKVQRFATQFSGLIEDISRFADLKPASGKFETVDLNEIVLMVCSQLSSQIQEKQAWIEKDALPSIEAVPVLMTQLFMELIRNALWFSQKELSPIVKIVLDHGEVDPGYITIRITDNGIGIADYHLHKVFDVFERFHPDGALPGSGVGLAYCQKIVHYHGGSIAPLSVLGEGTTFVIRLPLYQV